MSTSIPQQESDTQQPNGFLAGLQTIDSILHSLIRLTQLTEEEQMEAGIYLGDNTPEEPI